MKRFVKYMHVPFDNSSRDKRELSVVRMLGCEIVVCAVGDEACVKTVDGYIVHQRARQLSSNRIFRRLQVLYSRFVREPNLLRRRRAHCISCHNLSALLVGWISTWFIAKSRKPLLVYDSHEFEIERHTEGKRNKVGKLVVRLVERFLMKKCAFSIMVNDSIADEVQRVHRLKDRPVVVRNIPNYWTINEAVCRRQRQEFCKQLGVAEDTFVVMYHGGIMPGRGIEVLMESISRLTEVAAVILGYGEEGYLEHLKQMASQLRISDRVLFHDAVHIDVLWQYVAAADVGVDLTQPVCTSYYLSLPNKLFENIQAATPIITSGFPERTRIVQGYEIGICVDPEDADEIDQAIERMRTDTEMYQSFKRNLERAKENLCWEKERRVLEEAYAKILL